MAETKRSELKRPWRTVLRLLGPGLVTSAVDLAAGVCALSPLCSGAQISHTHAIRLCRDRADRKHSVERRTAGGDLAKAVNQYRLFPDGGGCSRNHDKPLSVFLAGFAGSRGNASGQDTPSASRADQSRPF